MCIRDSGHRVDHQNIDGPTAHQRLGNLEGLLSGIRLGNQQLIDVHAQVGGITGIESMFGIDKGAVTAPFLSLGNNVQPYSCLLYTSRCV